MKEEGKARTLKHVFNSSAMLSPTKRQQIIILGIDSRSTSRTKPSVNKLGVFWVCWTRSLLHVRSRLEAKISNYRLHMILRNAKFSKQIFPSGNVQLCLRVASAWQLIAQHNKMHRGLTITNQLSARLSSVRTLKRLDRIQLSTDRGNAEWIVL